MIESVEDLETELTRLERRLERLDDSTLLVSVAPGLPPAALSLSPPVLVAQVEIGPVPQDSSKHASLFRKLLEYNADSLVHAAYAVSGSSILLVAALELVSLDSNELDAVLSDFDLALGQHTPHLKALI